MNGGCLYDAICGHISVPLQSVNTIASEIAKGLLFLHSAKPKIIHHDLTPMNILLDEHGMPKVIIYFILFYDIILSVDCLSMCLCKNHNIFYFV